MKLLWLVLKNLLFTVLGLGFVAGWVPLHWFERRAVWPVAWAWTHYAALGLAAVAAAAYLACLGLFTVRGQGTPLPFDPPRRFVRRGLYQWVRNPMDLACLGLVAAEALFFRSWHIAVYLVCLACLFHLVVMLHEEDALRFRYGAMYEDYRRDVPRWLPRRPRPGLQTVAPFEVRR